ncbi:MAG: hypothetical protein BWY31_00402 [Lentisphaerae bacterium ADurb.Bin242]|nr:MAG: hypothetical protein BWY31_00402 [Lentisphaerae bacterium ADurb.Bin242]
MNKMPSFPQGELAFVELLKKHDSFFPNWNLSCGRGSDELDAAMGVKIDFQFPDPERLLDTAIFDFNRFLNEAGIAGDSVVVTVRKASDLKVEACRLTVEDGIILESGDTEGVRRGIYHLRDLIATSPRLEKGTTERSPWLKNRISRCFFGPIKRPPFNIDELMNDIDYYPEEYLSQLAHECINGLWLTIEFREICDTTIRKAPPEAARRIAKLRAVVEKCRRYGIKIWVFCIEPMFWSATCHNPNPVPKGYEELLGTYYPAEDYVIEMNSFCPNSETAWKYLYESTNYLFREVPHLGGMITISHGERLTSCLSEINVFGDGSLPCKNCELSVSEVASKVLEPMKQGIKDANPEAGFISWLYMAGMAQHSDWIYQIPSRLTEDTVLAFNFESGIAVEQADKVRVGGDYWLSRTGPSDRFGRMAEAAKGHCDLAAKLQVACSHEVATIPYVPVPGLLYRKYRAMKRLGVHHVIQCWYFGNYPGLMNKAAGNLAYEDFSGTEDDFLESLAKSDWGKDYHPVVSAWKSFAEGYSHYPLDNSFQYYGPMHDGPVWPLYLKPVHSALTRSWQPDDFPAGDAIGECMAHFELGELVELTRSITRKWREGMEELRKVDSAHHTLEFTLAEALDIQFRSGHNILNFYGLRNALLSQPHSAQILLDGMEKIIREEIDGSLHLAELCRKDSRLGYHSEAEVYKYFPAKLEWRADVLREVLEQDIPAARTAAARGENMWTCLCPDDLNPAVPGKIYGANGIRWSFELDSDFLVFHLDFEGNMENPETVQLFFMDADCIRKPGEKREILKRNHTRTATGWHADVKVSYASLHFAPAFRFGMERVTYHPDGSITYSNDKDGCFSHDVRLIFWYFMPEKTRLLKI